MAGHEYNFNYDFNPFHEMVLRMTEAAQASTVEEIEMHDCAFLWDLGIQADEDIVRPSLEPDEREKHLTRFFVYDKLGNQ